MAACDLAYSTAAYDGGFWIYLEGWCLGLRLGLEGCCLDLGLAVLFTTLMGSNTMIFAVLKV